MAAIWRTISQCIALMPGGSTATIDPDFAQDVAAAIAAHQGDYTRQILEAAPGETGDQELAI